MISTSDTDALSISANSNRRSSSGPSKVRWARSLPVAVRTSTVTGSVASLKCVTRMPAPKGFVPHASETGHGGSPSAFGGSGTVFAPALATAAVAGGPGSTVLATSTGSGAVCAAHATTVAAAAAATAIADIPVYTCPPGVPPPTSPAYPFTCPSIRFLANFSGVAASVDDPLCDVGQRGVAVLGELAQHLERPHVVHAVAFHDDALRLPDAVPRRQGRFQLLSMAAGQNRRGRMRCQDRSDRLGVGVPNTRLESEQIERTSSPVGGVELERQSAHHADLDNRL